MSDKKLLVGDLVKYSEKNFKEVKDILYKLKVIQSTYIEMDNLYDLDGLETSKREFIAQLEILAEHYARVKRFKTMGDYLENIRKYVKAEAINILVKEEGISINQAEKKVYAYGYYNDRIKLMENIKGYFINVEQMYIHYQQVLNSLVQSISLVKKDANYKFTTNG